MEPEGSLTCSQGSTTVLYPEPDESILFLQDPFNIIPSPSFMSS
jgi:hypothetical protein